MWSSRHLKGFFVALLAAAVCMLGSVWLRQGFFCWSRRLSYFLVPRIRCGFQGFNFFDIRFGFRKWNVQDAGGGVHVFQYFELKKCNLRFQFYLTMPEVSLSSLVAVVGGPVGSRFRWRCCWTRSCCVFMMTRDVCVCAMGLIELLGPHHLQPQTPSNSIITQLP